MTTSNHDLAFNAYQYEDLKIRSQGRVRKRQIRYPDVVDRQRGNGSRDILNAGLGLAEFSFLLGSLGHSVEGIDPGAEYVDLARAQAAKFGLNKCNLQRIRRRSVRRMQTRAGSTMWWSRRM